ncbi:hypothetical protein P5673_022904 [Acropora cervicornis]|uniref:Dolichol phosphate-mannose biosynthesis regulatory protein n=1 Tax=Acropora cervicornis TaxID=6130 RepID=A0AAD9UZD6_ACRCE|nr:hypothetical protein P5673_022904 [Acropora cervicornis]
MIIFPPCCGQLVSLCGEFSWFLVSTFSFFGHFTMATGTDRAAGYGMMLVSALIFVYYTIWVVFLGLMKRMSPLDSRFMLSTSSNNNLAENLLHFFTSLLGCHDNGIFVAVVILKSRKPVPKKDS